MGGLAVAILAASIPLGPATEGRGFSLSAETRNFAFYTRDDLKVDAARSQRFLDDTARRLGVRVQGRRPYFRYRWTEELAFVVGPDASSASGAYLSSGEIHSTKAFDAHEIVHRVAFELGDPGAFFQEGLAVALGDDGRYGDVKVDEIARGLLAPVDLRTLIERFQTVAPEVRYPLAGSFVRFLIRRHGLARLAEFFRACASDGRAREAQFARVMGSSLHDEGRGWIASLSR